MYGAGLFPDLRDLTCFAQADGQRTLVRDPVHQLRHDRDGAGKHRAVANRLRKKSRAPGAPTLLTRSAERAKQRSSASFQTKPPLLQRSRDRFRDRHYREPVRLCDTNFSDDYVTTLPLGHLQLRCVVVVAALANPARSASMKSCFPTSR